jgi:hypothetical protein
MEVTQMYKKTLTAMLAVFAAVALAACGGGGEEPAPAGGGESTPATTAPAAGAIDPMTIADAGVISGVINFGGDAPQPTVLQMAADPYCVTAHAGQDVLSQRVVVNDNGTLRWVFVYVKDVDGTFVGPTESVTLNQTGCMYDPHVLGMQANETLTILNSDDTLHNVNAQPTVAGNQGFNFAQPVRGMTHDQTFTQPEIMVPVKCDVHPWMQAYIGVASNPYFAVTGEDGSFSISHLAPGTYTVGAWHESLGEQEMEVTVEANGTAEVNFDFGS